MWWTQTSFGIRLPRATSEQASHSSSSCCVLAPVDYGCHPKSEHVSVSQLEAHCLYFAGESWNLFWGVVLMVWMNLDRGPMPTSDLLFLSELYFDIFCPTSNPAVKHCHLVFYTSQVKSFHTAHLFLRCHPTVVYSILSSLKKPNGFWGEQKVNKSGVYSSLWLLVPVSPTALQKVCQRKVSLFKLNVHSSNFTHEFQFTDHEESTILPVKTGE